MKRCRGKVVKVTVESKTIELVVVTIPSFESVLTVHYRCVPLECLKESAEYSSIS
jgi:hypothetical protein